MTEVTVEQVREILRSTYENGDYIDSYLYKDLVFIPKKDCLYYQGWDTYNDEMEHHCWKLTYKGWVKFTVEGNRIYFWDENGLNCLKNDEHLDLNNTASVFWISIWRRQNLL